MDVRYEVRVHHALSPLFTAFRDRFEEIGAALPRVRAMNVQQRTDHEHEVVQTWKMGVDAPPPSWLRRGLQTADSEFSLRTRWTADMCEWELEGGPFGRSVTGEGLLRFTEADDVTAVVLAGQIDVRLDAPERIPPFVAERAAPELAAQVRDHLGPHLEAAVRALGDLLETE